ncbi:MAG TPA: 5-deoxy-glucuronate isomerase [Candidatus Limnocylindrales bacterium]|nr:5-deoxy-glucuronate isomerase [Candidatus Limnocylindrales bacterium]
MIAAMSPRNTLADEDLRVRAAADGISVSVDPARAGWRYLSFDVVDARGAASFAEPGSEAAVVVISGRDVEVESAGSRWLLEGRAGPFDALPWALWLPDAADLHISSRNRATVAVARAPRSTRDGVATKPVLVTPGDVDVEIRGAGNASRQINHIVKPGFPADRLLLVEVITPSGNWSSWPPHKHDVDDMPAEAVLEEIYCYQFRRPEAWAIQRLYRRAGTPATETSGPRDALFAVRHGEVVLVTDSYHPFAATHGDDAYYLNALAGDRRTMACSFDPDLDGVRDAWPSMETDARLPLVR